MLAPIHESLRLPLPDGGELCGDLSYAQHLGDRAVVWAHGFGSHRGGEKAQALEAACSRRGWTFAAFDFRGHGQSSGVMRELRASRLLADLSAIHEHLRDRGIRKLALVGSSMGGFAAAWFALQAGLDTAPVCVAVAPGFRFVSHRWDRLSDEQRVDWQRSGVLAVRNEWVTAEIEYGFVAEREQFRMEDLAARWDRPLLVFHGMQDEIVPWQSSAEFADSVSCSDVELRLYREGDHRLTLFKDEIAEESCRFVERHWEQKNSPDSSPESLKTAITETDCVLGEDRGR